MGNGSVAPVVIFGYFF